MRSRAWSKHRTNSGVTTYSPRVPAGSTTPSDRRRTKSPFWTCSGMPPGPAVATRDAGGVFWCSPPRRGQGPGDTGRTAGGPAGDRGWPDGERVAPRYGPEAGAGVPAGEGEGERAEALVDLLAGRQ